MQVGFLYLRYVAEPKTLWGWYEPYIKDDEVHNVFLNINYKYFLHHSLTFFKFIQEFSPGSNGKMTTMGVYVRDLVLGQV